MGLLSGGCTWGIFRQNETILHFLALRMPPVLSAPMLSPAHFKFLGCSLVTTRFLLILRPTLEQCRPFGVTNSCPINLSLCCHWPTRVLALGWIEVQGCSLLYKSKKFIAHQPSLYVLDSQTTPGKSPKIYIHFITDHQVPIEYPIYWTVQNNIKKEILPMKSFHDFLWMKLMFSLSQENCVAFGWMKKLWGQQRVCKRRRW